MMMKVSMGLWFLFLVAAGGEAQEQAPGQSLGIASLPNLRDVGGLKTRDGKVVRTKLLYRCGQLSGMSAGDKEKLAALGLKTDFDLRTKAERGARPDTLPPGVKEVSLDVLADADLRGITRLSGYLQRPKEANEALGNGKVVAEVGKLYRDLVMLPSAQKSLRQFYLDLGQEANLPAVVHCTSGKDRTGWAVAALLALLGVPEEDIIKDYLRSNDYVLPGYQKRIDAFAAAGGDPELAKAMYGVKAEFLKASFAAVKEKYGSIEGYFEKGLGIDAAGQQALRERLLVR